MNKYLLALVLFYGCNLILQAQTIQLEFPYFVGKTYDFTIFQGDKRITLKSDVISEGGKVQLTIPEKHKGYKGMATWYLTNSETGGGLELVINNEDFSVSCLDAIPNEQNIIYKNTTENLVDIDNYKKQQDLFAKHDAMLATIRAYDKESEFYKLATKEYNSLKKQYEDYVKYLSASPLYAAKFRQIVNLSMGIGTIITLDEQEKANNINDFIVNELDYELLYTSNHWGGIITSWTEIQTLVFKDDTKWIADATKILNRIKNNQIYTDFVSNLTTDLTRAGKDNVLFALIPVIKNSKKLLNYDGVLNMYKQDLSGKAPDLVFDKPEGSKQKNNIVKTDKLNSKYTLLFFYQSGCGHCETTIEELKTNYKQLTAKGIKIISIAADTDLETYIKTANSFPWPDKHLEAGGMNGINFKNYAVIGTPTLYLLDSKGMVIKKTAGFAELQDWLNKK